MFMLVRFVIKLILQKVHHPLQVAVKIQMLAAIIGTAWEMLEKRNINVNSVVLWLKHRAHHLAWVVVKIQPTILKEYGHKYNLQKSSILVKKSVGVAGLQPTLISLDYSKL